MASTVVLNTPRDAAQWLKTRVTGTLHTDSRRLGPGDGFIAWPGAATDGRQYLGQALALGATACVAEQAGAQGHDVGHERVALYAGLKAATGPIAAEYFGHPSRDLTMVAVTGTNGKTSTAWWLAQALSANARRCAMIGTLGIGEPPDAEPTGLTTPDPVMLQQALRRFLDQGMQACVMEASSIGIVERRLDGTCIDVAVLTNFTQDHLDYHDSMQAYWHAKAELFFWPGLKAAVLNIDDDQGLQLHAQLGGRSLDLWSVGIDRPARLQAFNIRHTTTGQTFDVVEGQAIHAVTSCSIGRYNVTNLLGVMGTMRALGIPLAAAARSCADLIQVPGRMEVLGGNGQPLVVVDYAHTPDALDKALQALSDVARERGGALWCVFGCGGDRDVRKRPMMGAVAERYARHLVLTSDNPRSEQPQAIVDGIVQGLARPKKVSVELDRQLAIHDSVRAAGAPDVILVAGKGHEPYQEMAGRKVAFSDLEQVRNALVQRGTAP